MNEVSCEVIKDLMPLYADHICSEDSTRLVSEHLKECDKCRKEYEQITREIPVEQSGNSQSAIAGISKRWKRDRKKAFLVGFISLFLIVIAGYAFLDYSFRHPSSVSAADITVSNVSELKNGNIFFTLEIPDRVYPLTQEWRVKDNAVFITIDAFKYNIFNRKVKKYNFGENTLAKSNWMFNVKIRKIDKIYYSTKLPENTDDLAKDSVLIWSSDMKTAKADSTIQTYVKTYSCFGNEEIGNLAFLLYAAKNPYVGDMPANDRLLGALNIGLALGSYQNKLQTSEEPYGWTLELKDFIDDTKEKEYKQIMTRYSYILLALTGNLGEVTWTYKTENGTELKQMTITAKDATEALGENIKNYSESSNRVQELLFAIGME